MFENISFLFLFAMGLLSWAVLCLQHLVEIQRRAASDYRVEFYKERPEITFEPQVSHKPSDPNPPRRAFDFAMSFWVILVVTFALSKLLQVAEKKARSYLKGLETLKPVNAVDARSPTESPAAEPLQVVQQTLDPVVAEENVALKEQLNVLETHCLEMRELLQELTLRKSTSSQGSLQSEESVMVVNVKGSIADLGSPSRQSFPLNTSSSQQNIYIANSHIHIRGPVFCSDSNYSMELSRQASMYERKQSEFVQVWGKYIAGPKERPMIAGSMRCNNILL